MSTPAEKYIGRFAPSPTGPLHFGSLLAAMASYLDARASGGTWLVRMEDLDPPREPPGTADLILRQLEAFGLEWDGEILYQSRRLYAYEEALAELTNQNLCFVCDCSRARIKSMGNIYGGFCRESQKPFENGLAVRVKVQSQTLCLDDLVQGSYVHDLESETGDFVILRKDGLFAYQLAVVADDAFQEITHVIRGYDLMNSTPRQYYLQQLLQKPHPQYGHVPVIVNDKGQKLSKQHYADSVDADSAGEQIWQVLDALNQNPPDDLLQANPAVLLQWGIEHWDIQAVPKLANINQASLL